MFTGLSVNGFRLHISAAHLDLQFLIQRVVYPQVNVSPPVPLLLYGWDVGDGPLIHVSGGFGIGVAFHQTQVVKPSVVVVWIGLRGKKSQRVIKKTKNDIKKLNNPPVNTIDLQMTL